MPANLNALIRYKTINSCLYGGKRKWSISELIEACSSALSESRGRYGKISERTIRDDIRVMRSEILGFNAPIKQKSGLYYYEDPHYSILSVGITDLALIEKIIKMLLDIRNEVRHPELEIILKKLMDMSPDLFTKQERSGISFSESSLHRDISVEESEVQKSFGITKKTDVRIKPATSEISSVQDIGPLLKSSPSSSYLPSLSWGDLLGAILI